MNFISRWIRGALTLICASGTCPQILAQGDPKPLGLPDYTQITGFVPGSVLPEREPIPLWKVTAASKVRNNGAAEMVGLTNPVVAEGVVYHADDLGRVFALAAADGEELWMHEHGKRISAKPSVDGNQLYFGSEAGITALRRDTGVVLWQHQVEHGANETTPLPIGQRVYAAGYDGKCYALDRATGRMLWSHDLAKDAPEDQPGFPAKNARFQNIVARPRGAACDGQILVQGVFDQSRFVAVDCQTGQRRWSFRAGGWTGSAPTIVGEHVLVNSQDKHVYCLERSTGRMLWKFQAASWLSSQPAVHAGRVYQACNNCRLYALELGTGRLIWTYEPADEADRKGLVYSFPVLSGGLACFATGKGELLAIDLAQGTLRWKLRPAEKSELFTDPATDGRRLFVTCRPEGIQGESALYAIGVEAP